MGRHPRAGGLAATRAATCVAALFPQRRGHHQSFPDLLPSLHLPGAIDGELLVVRDGRVQKFQRLAAAAEPQRWYRRNLPRIIRSIFAPMICSAKAKTDLRTLPFAERGARLEAFVAKLGDRLDRSLAGGTPFNDLGRARPRRAQIG